MLLIIVFLKLSVFFSFDLVIKDALMHKKRASVFNSCYYYCYINISVKKNISESCRLFLCGEKWHHNRTLLIYCWKPPFCKISAMKLYHTCFFFRRFFGSNITQEISFVQISHKKQYKIFLWCGSDDFSILTWVTLIFSFLCFNRVFGKSGKVRRTIKGLICAFSRN